MGGEEGGSSTAKLCHSTQGAAGRSALAFGCVGLRRPTNSSTLHFANNTKMRRFHHGSPFSNSLRVVSGCFAGDGRSVWKQQWFEETFRDSLEALGRGLAPNAGQHRAQ